MHFSKTCAVFCQLSEVHCPIIDYRLSWSFRIQSMFCREMRKCLHSNIKIQDTCLESRAIFFFILIYFFLNQGNLVELVYPTLACTSCHFPISFSLPIASFLIEYLSDLGIYRSQSILAVKRIYSTYKAIAIS